LIKKARKEKGGRTCDAWKEPEGADVRVHIREDGELVDGVREEHRIPVHVCASGNMKFVMKFTEVLARVHQMQSSHRY